MDEPCIEEVSGNDRQLVATLTEAGLPVDDLSEPGRQFFRFTEKDRVVGFIGLEIHCGAAALLRSLVVVPEVRGAGVGKAITGCALTRLSELGVTEAYALTTTAASFVKSLGFVPCAREAAPSAIRGSRQFAGLCPASAVLLRRPLP